MGIVYTILGVLVLAQLYGIRKSIESSTKSRGSGSSGDAAAIAALRDRLSAVENQLASVRSGLDDLRRDHDILDELEENVMHEWAHIIEDKLGKRPVEVPCPRCGHEGGLEPNLLADEDTEFGCPNCGTVFAVGELRERFPDHVF